MQNARRHKAKGPPQPRPCNECGEMFLEQDLRVRYCTARCAERGHYANKYLKKNPEAAVKRRARALAAKSPIPVRYCPDCGTAVTTPDLRYNYCPEHRKPYRRRKG